jgi:ribonuclease BN (tRNA processing enzyme)
MLGTGTTFPNAERFASAILVEVAGKRLLFECGRGAVIRLTQAGVSPSEIDGLFLTHLHSDHVVGIPDLWLSGWFWGAIDLSRSGDRKQRAACRSTLPRHSRLTLQFVRPLRVFRLRAQKSMRGISSKEMRMMTAPFGSLHFSWITVL